MMTYHSLLNEGKKRLIDAGYSDQTAMVLMNELCSHKNINLYMEMENQIDPDVQTDFLEAVHRMEKQEPLAYILGYEPFYGYDFTVNENVLIPRPETEELVGQVLMNADEMQKEKKDLTVFDVACGSGAIGITLSLEDPDLKVMASDISEKAVETARGNNEKLGADVQFYTGDMLDPFIENDLHCDILVCNPPYIPAAEQMEESVVNYEPHIALFGGKDGLYFYRQVFAKARQVLNEGGMMAFEMGWDQRERLSALAASYFPEADIEVMQDINGKDRMLFIRMPGNACFRNA
jgi:release factor glutamine methyltransferase